MSKNQPPRVQFDFEPDLSDFEEQHEDVSIDHTPSITTEIHDDDSESVMLPEVIEEPIVEKEIFDMAENIREEVPVETLRAEPQLLKKPAKINKNGKPRKPMSEAHKAKLASSREKALQARKLKAEERKKAKELEKEERELLKAQKVKRVQKLREEVNDEEAPTAPQPSVPAPQAQQSTQSFSREDLERAQLDAIIKYEALRKNRKEEKKKKEMLEKQQQDMRNKIKRATEPQQYKYGDGSNRWDNCY